MFNSSGIIFIMSALKLQNKETSENFYKIAFALQTKDRSGDIYYSFMNCYIKEDSLFVLLKKQVGSIVKAKLSMYKTKDNTYIPQIIGLE